MSEKNQRHWLDLRHGYVETSDESDPGTTADYYEDRPERYKEVQVAPLDAIVIDRADLPEEDSILHYRLGDGVERVKSGSANLVVRGASPEYAESMARHYLALARWLREHPPVDEAQVNAIQHAYKAATGDTVSGRQAAELYRLGVRVEVG